MKSEIERMVEAVERMMAEGLSKNEAVEKVTENATELEKMVVEMGLEK